MTQNPNQKTSQIYSGPVASVRIGLKYQSIFCYLVQKVSQNLDAQNPSINQLINDLITSIWLENTIRSESSKKVTTQNIIDINNTQVIVSDFEILKKESSGSVNQTDTDKENQEIVQKIKSILKFLEESQPQQYTQLKQNITIFEKIKKSSQEGNAAKNEKFSAEDNILETLSKYNQLEQKYPKADRAIYLISPTVLDQSKSLLDLVVSGNGREIMMVECGASLIEEDIINRAIDLANLEIQKLIKIQQAFVQMVSQSE